MLLGDFRQTKIIIQLFELIEYFEFCMVAGARNYRYQHSLEVTI